MKSIGPRPALLMALALVAALAPGRVRAAILFGTDRFDGRLYTIDTDTLATELVSSNLLVPPTAGTSPNGNATDVARGVFYYTRFTPGELFALDLLADRSTSLGPLVGSVGSGAFFDGAFYYFSQSAGNLRRVTFDASGAVAADALVTNVGIAYNFGDIAVRGDGVLFGWAERVSGGSDFFSVDLSGGNAFALIATGQSSNLGLAFGDDGVLYGHRADTQELLRVDVATGARTSLGVLDRSFSDLATGVAVPEPASWALLGLGALGLLGRAWRRRRAA